MTYTEQLTRDYAAIRARLYGPARRQARVLPPEPEPEPEPEPIGLYTHRRSEIRIPDARFAAKARHVIGMVAAWHFLTPEDIVGGNRRRHVVAARQDAVAAVFLICRKAGRPLTLNEMGRFFGGRDHTTILHALRKRGFDRVDLKGCGR